MNSTHRLTQHLLESFHARISRLESQYLSGIERTNEKDEEEERRLLSELYQEYLKRYPNQNEAPFELYEIHRNDWDNEDLYLPVSKMGVLMNIHVKACLGKPGFKYTICIINMIAFRQEDRSKSDKRLVKENSGRKFYDSFIDCKDANDVLTRLAGYYQL